MPKIIRRILLLIPILFLIIATAVTKKSTKKLDDNIYETKENLRRLESKYEFVLLDYNYLSSPKKLLELSRFYFEQDLVQKKKENLIWLNINADDFSIVKDNSSDD